MTSREPATKSRHERPAPTARRNPPRLFGPEWDRGISQLPAWAEPITEFRKHLAAQGRTTATAYGYCREVRAFGDQHPAGPWDVTRAQLETWLDHQNWSRATRHRVLTSLRAFYAWAVTTDRCAWAPTAGIALTQRAPGPARRALPSAWVEPLGDYLNHLRAGARSPGTVERYRDQLTRLAQSLADPWTVTPQQLEDWLSNHDWAPETKRTTRAVLHLGRDDRTHRPFTSNQPAVRPRPESRPATHRLWFSRDGPSER
jgi:site-specific recombinase XerC